MASADPATGRSADGRCTITQTPSLWFYLGVWGLALLSCVTLLVAVLATRRVLAEHRTGARVAAVIVTVTIAVGTLLSAVLAPVLLNSDAIPRPATCRSL